MTTAAMATYAYDQIDQARTDLNAVSEFTCPRCAGESDIPDTDTSYESRQCGEVRKVKPKVTVATKS
jgi:hypothetical protein